MCLLQGLGSGLDLLVLDLEMLYCSANPLSSFVLILCHLVGTAKQCQFGSAVSLTMICLQAAVMLSIHGALDCNGCNEHHCESCNGCRKRFYTDCNGKLMMCSQEIQGKLCTADRQAAVLKSLQTQEKPMLQRLDYAFAVVELLRAQVVDAACDDPGSSILPHLVIPLIRDRLEAMALEPQVGSWSAKAKFASVTSPSAGADFSCIAPPPPPPRGAGGGGVGRPKLNGVCKAPQAR